MKKKGFRLEFIEGDLEGNFDFVDVEKKIKGVKFVVV